MKKEEYMGALQAALIKFDEELAQEIMMDYEERFRMGAERGKTEEEVIRELGSIKDLVEELGEMQKESEIIQNAGMQTSLTRNSKGSEQKENDQDWQKTEAENRTEEQYKNQENSYERKRGTYYQEKSFSESFDAAMRKFGKALDGVMKEAGRVLEEAAEQFEMHMEEAKKNRYYTYNGDGTFEGSEKDGEAQPNVEQSGQGMENCKRVVVVADIADVNIRLGKESKPAAVCHYYSHKTAMMYPFYAYQEGDTFYVGVRRQQNQEQKSGFFQFSMSPSISIEVLLPQGIESMEIDSTSGNLELTEVPVEDLRLKSKSGNLSVSYLTGSVCHMEALSGALKLVKSTVDTAELTTKSGNCEVNRLEADRLMINTASGEAEIREVQAENIAVNTMSGDINADDITTETVRFGTSSGDVDLCDCRGGQMEIATTSGDISVHADYELYQVYSQSGNVDLESRHDADITMQTTSGDTSVCMLETTKAYQIVMHSISGECVCSGYKQVESEEIERQIQVKTISGDIDVRFV